MDTPTSKRPHFKINNKKYNFGANDNPIFMEIRRHLLDRDTFFEISLNKSSPLFVSSNQGEIALSYLMAAYSIHRPFVNDDFDYLKQNIRQIGCKTRSLYNSLLISYEVRYLTSQEQETQIKHGLDEIMVSLCVNDKKSDLLKTKLIYDFILSNVEYDFKYANHSAYNALFDKKAVCEGCAALLYRMLCFANVPCRIITGKGLQDRHAWNIAKIGKYWYNLDVTWDLYCRKKDRVLTDYRWFLKGEQTFLMHTRDPQYTVDGFVSKHLMANIDYYT